VRAAWTIDKMVTKAPLMGGSIDGDGTRVRSKATVCVQEPVRMSMLLHVALCRGRQTV